MGILNVTPDSFSDGGLHGSTAAALARAEALILQGADILDIGGESTRPGATPVSVQEEMDRILPVIEALRGIPISVDTFKPEVMTAAIAAGVHMINDIEALQNPAAMQAVCNANVAVCLMHKQGSPETMQILPQYTDVVAEVQDFLAARIADAVAQGIDADRILVDPGFGFGKTLAHNLELLRRMSEFKSLGVPLLAGMSRKSMLGAITNRAVGERMPASIAAALMAVQQGAAVVRVHDVRETVDALKIWDAMSGEYR